MDTFPFDIAPDWGLTNTPTVDVEETELGDGYILRRPKGINYIRESFPISWAVLSKSDADAIFQWLKARLKLTAFWWVEPDSGIRYKVTCSSLTKVITEFNNYSVSATFVQDFNL